MEQLAGIIVEAANDQSQYDAMALAAQKAAANCNIERTVKRYGEVYQQVLGNNQAVEELQAIRLYKKKSLPLATAGKSCNDRGRLYGAILGAWPTLKREKPRQLAEGQRQWRKGQQRHSRTGC